MIGCSTVLGFYPNTIRSTLAIRHSRKLFYSSAFTLYSCCVSTSTTTANLAAGRVAFSPPFRSTTSPSRTTTTRMALSTTTTTTTTASSTVNTQPHNDNNNDTRPFLRGVVFDMDGTLTVPNLDFVEMYRRCGVNRDEDILEAVSTMTNTNPPQARAARLVIEEMEEEGRRTLTLAPGAVELTDWLRRHGVPMALVTRNTKKTVDVMVNDLFRNDDGSLFSPALSRDTVTNDNDNDNDNPMPVKPHPAALEYIKQEWNFVSDDDNNDNDLLMVGDSPSNDVAFGKAAGVATALIDTGRRFTEGGKNDGGADLVCPDLLRLAPLIWQRFRLVDSNSSRRSFLLGTKLLKFPPPVPSGPAALAAVRGDVDALSAMTTEELWSMEDDNDNDDDNVYGRNTPLVWAADAGQRAVVELLLRRLPKNNDDRSIALLDARGYLGATAVCRACRRGHVDVLEALLEFSSGGPKSKLNVDAPNSKMQSPLHFAAFQEHADILRLLLAYGANTRVLDRKGRTPDQDTKNETIRNMIVNIESTE